MKIVSLVISLIIFNLLLIKCENPEEVLETARLVNNYFMSKYPDPTIPTNVKKIRPSNLWTRSVYYEGLMELNDIDPQQEYLNGLISINGLQEMGFKQLMLIINAVDKLILDF